MIISIKRKASYLKSMLYKYRFNNFKLESFTKEFIYNTLLKIEESDRKYKGSFIGRGIDPYFDSKPLDYPMAYSLYVKGFIEMYKFTKSKEWIKKAINAQKILYKIKLKKQNSWGLPFIWENRGNEPYLITTAFVGHSFLDLYETLKEEEYIDRVSEIINWMINSLGYDKTTEGICFWYSPKVKKHVINASAEATGLLARWEYLNEKKNINLKEIISDSLKYITKKQLTNYMWDYYGESDEPNSIIDFHNNYIIESNCYLRDYYDESKIDQMLKYPFFAICKNLLNNNGSLKINLNKTIEARLWAYGAFLYTGIELLNILKNEEDRFELKKILGLLVKYIFSNLYSKKMNGFKYKSDKPETKYVRHASHMYYALSKLLNSKEFWV
jgi:hypothetical protein